MQVSILFIALTDSCLSGAIGAGQILGRHCSGFAAVTRAYRPSSVDVQATVSWHCTGVVQASSERLESVLFRLRRQSVTPYVS